MYETFYRLRERPFSLLPDPEFLYYSPKHKTAMSLLEYGLMSQASFTVVTGEIGTGKTTLIRQLLRELQEDVTVGLITNTNRSFGELLQWVLLAFGLNFSGKDKVELYRIFNDFLIQQYAQNRRTILIIDEAQNMSVETLEELRTLSNINADKFQVLQIFLVGQAQLRETLARPELIQFAQRIGLDYHLEALTREETQAYVLHRVQVAGGSAGLFTPEACTAIHEHSGGIPRLINLLADTALVYGYAEQREEISAALIDEVAREKQQGGLFPTANSRVNNRHRAHLDVSRESPPVNRRRLRAIAVTGSPANGRNFRTILENCGVDVVSELHLGAKQTVPADLNGADVVFVDLDNNAEQELQELDEFLQDCPLPILFNESSQNGAESTASADKFRKRLSLKLASLLKL